MIALLVIFYATKLGQAAKRDLRQKTQNQRAERKRLSDSRLILKWEATCVRETRWSKSGWVATR